MNTGIYFGSCHNTTADMHSKLALMVESIAGNTVFGTLGIYGDLLGGSAFRGQLFGDQFEFQTVDPNDPVTIIWRGTLSDGSIKGSYNATIRKFLYKLIGFANQEGTWEVSLAQTASDSILSAADSSLVRVRSDAGEEGPLAFPYFSDLMLQGKWPRDAEIQIDGRTEWIPLGMIQDAFIEAMPQEAKEESMMKGIGSEATKKVIGGIVATVVLSILGIDAD
ncbi:MAG: hypothetical protein ACPG32_11685 [Akkermansiaceae bacterium]